MTLLDQIIEDATNDSVSTASLLRKVIIVAHRLRAQEVEQWARAELDGFEGSDHLPKYRQSLTLPVQAVWTGYGGSMLSQSIGAVGVPEESKAAFFRLSVTQSLEELEHLASLPEDPGVPWDPWQVVMFNEWVEKGHVPGFEDMALLRARKVLTTGVIRGVLGNVRNTALDFALNLQTANPDAGSLHGPTVAEPGIASSVFNVTNNIFGPGANVAQGSGISQTSTVTAGDITGLLQAAQAAGLTDTAAARDLAAAATAAIPEREGLFARVVEKVKAGTYTLASGVTTGTAAGLLEEAVKGYLGMH